MSHWNNRVVKVTYNKGEEYEEVSFEIREVYYTSSGEIWAISEHPVSVTSDDIGGLCTSLARLAGALKHEVIDYDTVTYAKSEYEDDDED